MASPSNLGKPVNHVADVKTHQMLISHFAVRREQTRNFMTIFTNDIIKRPGLQFVVTLRRKFPALPLTSSHLGLIHEARPDS